MFILGREHELVALMVAQLIPISSSATARSPPIPNRTRSSTCQSRTRIQCSDALFRFGIPRCSCSKAAMFRCKGKKRASPDTSRVRRHPTSPLASPSKVPRLMRCVMHAYVWHHVHAVYPFLVRIKHLLPSRRIFLARV
ncbi:hypothetical protein BDZ89DRAFT_156986 [Hymenopellis radicata]|nr:hypothetical protein BDZ89DRAFT_156986 [Hymenopellis radicata]